MKNNLCKKPNNVASVSDLYFMYNPQDKEQHDAFKAFYKASKELEKYQAQEAKREARNAWFMEYVVGGAVVTISTIGFMIFAICQI